MPSSSGQAISSFVTTEDQIPDGDSMGQVPLLADQLPHPQTPCSAA
jgi:hypothetical protein